MTTIAYRDGVMAGDSQGTTTKVILLSPTQKIFRLDNGSVLGMAGTAAAFEDAVEAMNKSIADGDENTLPRLPRSVTAMLAAPGELWIWEKGWEDYTAEPYMAIGVGWVIALSAMDAGASAKKAVEIACVRDIYTSGPVKTMKVR